jgi:hypothetical protein
MAAQGFLSKQDVKRFTGRGTRAGQVAWLQEQGIPFRPNGKDELVVAWTHVHAWLEAAQPCPEE